MLILDCESRSAALGSIAAIYGVATDSIDDFLRTFDIDAHFLEVGPLRSSCQELSIVFESRFNLIPKPIDRVCWFHLTRVAPSEKFSAGVQPLSTSLEYVWQTVLNVFKESPYYSNLLVMKRDGVPNFHYTAKIGNSFHGGPYAMLVRAVAECPVEMGNHDYLRLPEIMEDICNGYLQAHGEYIHDQLMQALQPTIVKFWSTKDLGFGCVESALYYLYLTAHDERLNLWCNTCFDGENEAISSEQIICVEESQGFFSNRYITM